MIDDSLSTANVEGSAIAVAAAINDSSAATGVTARVGESRVTGADVTGGRLGTDATIDNRLIINGQTITGFDVEAGDAGDALIDSINAVSDETGVIADRDASGGLSLSAQDGRNIEVQTTVMLPRSQVYPMASPQEL